MTSKASPQRDTPPSPNHPPLSSPTTKPNSTVKINLLFFARARELTQTSSTVLSIPTAQTYTAGDIKKVVRKAFPGLEEILPCCAVAVNCEYLEGEEEKGQGVVLGEGDEVGIISFISGG